MPFAQVNGTSLYYESHGSGRPIVFVHGLGASHAMFEPQVEVFSQAYRVITFDVRGSGRSGKFTGWRNILQRQAADLAALLDQLGIERTVVCGVSYGGVFVQRFVLDHPGRCAGLVVVDSFGDTWPQSLAELGLILAAYLAAPAYLLPPRWLVPAVRRQYQRWPLAQQHLERILAEMRGYETLKTRLAINRIHYTPALHQITCPALGIVGDAADIAVRLMRRVTDAIPNARLDVVAHSFDPTNLCQPDLFNQLLSQFLARIGWQRAASDTA